MVLPGHLLYELRSHDSHLLLRGDMPWKKLLLGLGENFVDSVWLGPYIRRDGRRGRNEIIFHMHDIYALSFIVLS
jgi:hypothetical protein